MPPSRYEATALLSFEPPKQIVETARVDQLDPSIVVDYFDPSTLLPGPNRARPGVSNDEEAVGMTGDADVGTVGRGHMAGARFGIDGEYVENKGGFPALEGVCRVDRNFEPCQHRLGVEQLAEELVHGLVRRNYTDLAGGGIGPAKGRNKSDNEANG